MDEMLWGFKASETLLGIETLNDAKLAGKHLGFKASETLLGIETAKYRYLTHIYKASKPLKPF